MNKHSGAGRFLTGLLLCILLAFSCKQAPDLNIPQRLPYMTALPVIPMRYIIPSNNLVLSMNAFAPISIQANTFNEIYSVVRYDAALGDSVMLFWNRETSLYLQYCTSPFSGMWDSLYCPLKPGEKVTIYRFQCNTGGEEVAEDLSSESEIVIRVENGVPTVIGSNAPEVAPLPAKTCACILAQAVYQGPFNYAITTEVDTGDDVPESDEENTFVEPSVANLRAQ